MPNRFQTPSTLEVVTLTIANGQSVSDVLTLGGASLVGLITPAAWTAADITFLGCDTAGGTFVPVWRDTGEMAIPSAQVPTAASRAFRLDPIDLLAWPYVQVRSGNNAGAVAQGAARSIKVFVRSV